MAQRVLDYPLLGSGAGKVAWQMQDLNALGAAGNATLATAAKGQAVLDDAGLQLAHLLAEVARLPLTTLCDTTAWQGEAL
jgi:creatinine amidohydrolase